MVSDGAGDVAATPATVHVAGDRSHSALGLCEVVLLVGTRDGRC